jgi:predicted TPR repeat methyltransferase
VEFRNVTNVLQEELADLVIAEDVLVELGHNLLELVVAADLLEQSL